MIEIYLDGVQLEVPQDISIGLNLGIADYGDPITASGAYTQTVEIPRTPHNDMAFKFSGEVLSAEMFNHSEHTARIVEDGCELVVGRAFLEGVSQTSYNMQVVGEEVGWVMQIRDKKLSELEGDYIGSYKPDDWGEMGDLDAEALPKLSWVLLQHGHWYQDTDDEPIRRTWATYTDLIPMVKLHTLLEHCFAGHTIVVSDAMRKALHQTYVSMAWKTDKKASVLAEDMDFEVTSNLLNANSEGELKVTIDADNRQPAMPLFDTIVEDKNGVLNENEGVISFTPTMDCTVSLELKTRYQTDTTFYSSTFTDDAETDTTWDDVAYYSDNPSFADQLFLPDADYPFVQYRVEDSIEFAYVIANKASANDFKIMPVKYGDSELLSMLSPKNLSLCYATFGNTYGLESVGYEIRISLYDNSGNVEYSETIYRPSAVVTNGVRTRKNMVFRATQCAYETKIKVDGKNYTSRVGILIAYRTSTGGIGYANVDKEISSGVIMSPNPNKMKCWCISTDGRITFDVALKMPPQRYNAGQSYPISQISFGSSGYGEGITVFGIAEGSLKPSFEWGVPIRERVKLSDVGGDALAEDMLRSIMQLYNLIIYTNPKTKQVNLYSFADFWNNNIVDWSDRIDLDSDISVSAMGDTIGKSVTLLYADGSPRIDYYNDRNSLPYFAYKKDLSTKMTKEEKEIANTLFTPAYMAKVAEEFGSGEGKVPAVAKKGEEGNVLDFNLADVPHTLVLIPEGEESADSARLPIHTEVFGDMGGIQPPMSAVIDGVATLSFADKDGIEGLHKHYDKQIALWEKGKRLTCYCRIEAWEIEALRHNAENINFRSLFHLNIKGEDIYGRLESIEYEPSNTTNKCVFIIE